MDTASLMQELKVKLVESLGLADVQPDEIGDDQPLFAEGLDLDSIDALELAVMIEESYGVKIDSKEAGQAAFASIRALAEFIAKARSE